MVQFYSGIAGWRGRNPKGVVIHNDAGSVYANAAHYRAWLPTHNAYNGFAHYYVAQDGIFQPENEGAMAWHTANSDGNANYIGIEACQSFGPENIFRQNEEASFKLAAQILRRYGLPANRNTVRLHKEFSSTSCPHRSWDLHGQSVNAVKDYFISRINAYMGGQPAPTPAPSSNPRKYNLDVVNVNSMAFSVSGWMTPVKACKGQDIWVYFMEDGKGEIARFKAKKVQRPDVQKAVNNPNGADVGFQCDGLTPKALMGKKYYFLIRYNNDSKEELYIREKVFTAPARRNDGYLDLVAGDANGVRLSGWHLNSLQARGDRHFLFIVDNATGAEYARFDITGNSYYASPDVQKLYGPEIAQRANTRFATYVKVAGNHRLRGKTVKIISRYAPANMIDKTTETDIVWGTYRI